MNKDKSISFHPIALDDSEQFIGSASAFELIADFHSDFPEGEVIPADWVPKLEDYTGDYFFVIESYVSTGMVGLNDDSSDSYNVSWVLERIEKVGEVDYVVFSGFHTKELKFGQNPFDNYLIGLEKGIIISLLNRLSTEDPDKFTKDSIANIIGLKIE